VRVRNPRLGAALIAALALPAVLGPAAVASATAASAASAELEIAWPTAGTTLLTGVEVAMHGRVADPAAEVEVRVTAIDDEHSGHHPGHGGHATTASDWLPASVVDASGHWRLMYTPATAGDHLIEARMDGDDASIVTSGFSVVGDGATDPTPEPGDGTLLDPAAPNPYEHSGLGEFQASCTPSHRSYHDPIVAPGNPRIWHLHQFFGNETTDLNSTTESLLGQSTTCSPDDDASAYWFPALLKDGEPVDPSRITVYYQAKYPQDPAKVETIPTGLRMIAGSAMARSDQPDTIVQWACIGSAGSSATIPDCGDQPLQMLVQFPECWNGVDLDSPDHKSHMAYANGADCPPSHPVLLPKVEFRVEFPVSGEGVMVSSDLPMPAMGMGQAEPGQSAHADFFNAWNPAALEQRVGDCLRGARVCNTAGAVIR
jgi:hypothetical protein